MVLISWVIGTPNKYRWEDQISMKLPNPDPNPSLAGVFEFARKWK